MSKILTPPVYRAILLPLLGAAGAVAALVWPFGYKAFCTGLSGVVL